MKRLFVRAIQEPWFWLLLALGVATAFFRLDGHGLWGDEIWQALWSRQQGLVETIWRFRAPPDFPLHFILVQLATSFSRDSFWVRLPSALLGAATVPLLFALGRRVFDKPTAIFAAVLLAISPFHIWFAQDARPYAALAGYSLLSLFFFTGLLKQPTLLAWLGLTIATTLNLYNHFFSLMPILSESVVLGIWLVLQRAKVAGLGRSRFFAIHRIVETPNVSVAFVSSMVVAFLLAAPLLPGYVSFIGARGPGEVEALPFLVTPAFLLELLGMFGGGTGWSLPLFLGLGMIGLVTALRRRNFFGLAALVWLAVPLIVLWVAQPRHIFIPRYFLFQQPVYLLVVAYGALAVAGWLALRFRRLPRIPACSGMPLSAAAFAVGGLAVVALVPPAWQSYWVERINDWGTMCDYLHREAKAGDAIAGDGYIVGLMMWCYPNPTTIPIIDGNRVPPASLLHRGLNVWFLNMDASTKKEWLQEHFTLIPRTTWGKEDLVVTPSSGDFTYLQAERVAQLWHFKTPVVPAALVLNDTDPTGQTGEGYAEIGQYMRYAIRLGLPAGKPRVLAATFQERTGGNVQVSIDGKVVGRFRAKQNNRKWRQVAFGVPDASGDTFLVEFFNPGGTGAGVRDVQVRYKESVADQ